MTRYGSECRIQFDNDSFFLLVSKPSRYAGATDFDGSYERTAASTISFHPG